MEKEKIITRIQDCGIVAVVRAETVDQAIRITDACIEGGVAAIELTFTVPHADKVIEELAKRYTPEEIILGAGTVLDAATARIAMLSGAEYIVSPALDLETLKLCNRYRVPMMPGIMTVREGLLAMENGADKIRINPGNIGGREKIKAVVDVAKERNIPILRLKTDTAEATLNQQFIILSPMLKKTKDTKMKNKKTRCFLLKHLVFL